MLRRFPAFRILFVLLLAFPTVLFERCAIIEKKRPFILHDDTIPRTSEPRPSINFYKGNFFQYYPIPTTVKFKKDTAR